MAQEFEYIIASEQKGQRLDQFLATLPELKISRSQAKKLIEEGMVWVNHQPTKSSYKIKTDDRVKVTIPPPPTPKLIPENIPLDIIYEDEDLIVINKPRGMVVHPAPGHYSGTLVNALLFHCQSLSNLGGPLRPGIVHRLDKDTSGLLVVAKNDAAYQSLTKQIKEKSVEKIYLALVHGTLKNEEGMIEARMGRHPIHRKKMAVVKGEKGREAITYYKVLKRFKEYTLLEIKTKTGRTHQIRVHLSYIGHPIVGDKTYGRKKGKIEIDGQLLHASRLGFTHPHTGKYVEFYAATPKEMQEIIQKIT